MSSFFFSTPDLRMLPSALKNWISEGRVSLPTHLWHVPWVGTPGEPGGPGGPGGPGEPLAGLAGPANLWYTQGASLAGPRTPGGGKALAHPWWARQTPGAPSVRAWRVWRRTPGGPGRPGEPLVASEPLAYLRWAWRTLGRTNGVGLAGLWSGEPGGPGALGVQAWWPWRTHGSPYIPGTPLAGLAGPANPWRARRTLSGPGEPLEAR